MQIAPALYGPVHRQRHRVPPAPVGVGPPPPRRCITASPTSPHPPCRGRRPRRPAVTVFASLTAFRPPRPGRGITSQYITWRTARFPPAVGVGVLDDPSRCSPPAPRGRAGCGRLKPPAKGEPPARVPPLTPSCASLSMGVFRALRRAARAPPLDPARFFVKKRGKKLLNASPHPAQTPRPWGE